MSDKITGRNIRRTVVVLMLLFIVGSSVYGQIAPAPLLKMDSTAQKLSYGASAYQKLQMGLRSRESIAKVVKSKLPKMTRLYNNRIKKSPGLEGEVKVKFRIDETGKVVFCHILESTMKDTVFETEIITEINGWIFDKINRPEDITDVIYPFVFKQDYELVVLGIIMMVCAVFISLLLNSSR